MAVRNPIAIFMKEHDIALVQLRNLKRSAQELRKKGFTRKAFTQLCLAAEFVDEEVRVHNKQEENVLFPVVERYVDGPTNILRDEHRKLIKMYKKMFYGINVLKENNDDLTAQQETCDAVDEIVQLMVNHIHKENHILFPLIQRFVPLKDLQKVMEKM